MQFDSDTSQSVLLYFAGSDADARAHDIRYGRTGPGHSTPLHPITFALRHMCGRRFFCFPFKSHCTTKIYHQIIVDTADASQSYDKKVVLGCTECSSKLLRKLGVCAQCTR
ncbi:hypothetical protein EVAR_63042_1 [Eumeta japonica]|uniref:Uncharacterized protein n=1 Tax=Eumeta variegata TaxID=151549 RepID=A0A4C1YYX7_EUMVA|nr:hypothetical protein EVAR_63042_1 [Eumeta japonica]